MKTEQRLFPRGCGEAVLASKQGCKICIKNFEKTSDFPEPSQARTYTSRAMPVFGSFPGPFADSGGSFQKSADTISTKISPSASATNSPTVVSSNPSLSISSTSNFSLLLSSSEHCQTESEHGPLPACAQTSAFSDDMQPFFRSTPRTRHKSRRNNGNNNIQDIAACTEQSAANSFIQLESSKKHKRHDSFVPISPPGLGPPSLLARKQRNPWLNRTVGFGKPQRRAANSIEFKFSRFPYGPASQPRVSPTPKPDLSDAESPRCSSPNMSQTYTESHSSQCAIPMRCSTSMPSPVCSTFGANSTSTTPLSSLFSFKSGVSTMTTPSTQGKYKANPPTSVSTYAREKTTDEMYSEIYDRSYRGTVTAAGPPGQELPTYIHSSPLAPQVRMWPATPPMRTRKRIFNSTSRDFASVDDHADIGFDAKTQRVEYTETHPLLSTSQDDVIDESDNAWNEIMADFPVSVERLLPEHDLASRVMDLSQDLQEVTMGSAGGVATRDIIHATSTTSNKHLVSDCTLWNRCQQCADLSYFDRLKVHPEISFQSADRFPIPIWERKDEMQNIALADLVRHSEPLRRRVMKPWGAVAEGSTSAAETA